MGGGFVRGRGGSGILLGRELGSINWGWGYGVGGGTRWGWSLFVG
jgi:hypothetical protein